MTYRDAIRANDTADFCIRIMERSLNRANAADAAPRARPSDRANSSVVSPLRASPRLSRGRREVTTAHLKAGQFYCPNCGSPRYAIERCCDEYAGETYWNGEPTPARVVRVIVGRSPVKTWWCADLEGTEREAVEVSYYGEKLYLDNENGSGWNKVTHGHGSPQWGHSSLPVAHVIETPIQEDAGTAETTK